MLFDLYYLESQDHPSIQHRIKADNVDSVIEFVKSKYTDYEFTDELGESDYSIYLQINTCPKCIEWNPEINDMDEEEKEDLCSMCEYSAYFEIRKLEDNEEESLRLIIDDKGNFVPHNPYEAFIDLTEKEDIEND